MTNGKQAILYLTHQTGKGVLDNFQKIREAATKYGNAIIAYHQNEEKIPGVIEKLDHFTFTDSILWELGYMPIVDSLLPGSNHFPLLKFYLQHPGYDYYWNIEDDVHFNGNWEYLFDTISRFKHDFVSCSIKKQEELPHWHWWEIFAHPSEEIPVENRVKSFNPVYRLSNQALQYLHNALLDQWSGHHEVLIPSLLYNKGFDIMDFGGKGYFVPHGLKNKFYTPGTMRYRPIFKTMGSEPNKLYHPIKELSLANNA